MPEDKEIIETVQEFCGKHVFDKKSKGHAVINDYKDTWRKHAKDTKGMEIKEERLSKFTTEEIQAAVQNRFGTKDILTEKKVGSTSELAFDIWNKTEGTAFEICLGAIKNEFEKDILKGILDQDTTNLVIFYREYATGARSVVYGKKWFEHPAQKEIMARAGIFKLKVSPTPLLI